MKKIIDIVKEEYKSKDKKVATVFLILNLLVVLCLIREIILGDMKHILTCICALVLLLIPSILHKKFKVVFADCLEIMIYILIFSSQILGEVFAFYIHIKIFDTILHMMFGFVMAGIGFSIGGILNNANNKFIVTSKYLLLFVFCFSMTMGVLWEIFEYSMDKTFKQDMQKDTIITEISSVILNEKDDNKAKNIDIETLIVNGEDYIEKYGGYIDIGLNDTMEDLIVNLVGAVAYLAIGYAYLKGNGKSADKFMIKK